MVDGTSFECGVDPFATEVRECNDHPSADLWSVIEASENCIESARVANRAERSDSGFPTSGIVVVGTGRNEEWDCGPSAVFAEEPTRCIDHEWLLVAETTSGSGDEGGFGAATSSSCPKLHGPASNASVVVVHCGADLGNREGSAPVESAEAGTAKVRSAA